MEEQWLDQLDEKDSRAREVLHGAVAARDLAYAPYSGFKMGAALVTDAGAVIKGALVENVSLGLAMCAERVALFTAVSNAAGKPEILALVSRRTDGEPRKHAVPVWPSSRHVCL